MTDRKLLEQIAAIGPGKIDNVIAQVKLNGEDHTHFKIQTRTRLDRLEEEKV